jgi:hypothetical protein
MGILFIQRTVRNENSELRTENFPGLQFPGRRISEKGPFSDGYRQFRPMCSEGFVGLYSYGMAFRQGFEKIRNTALVAFCKMLIPLMLPGIRKADSRFPKKIGAPCA